MCSDLLLRWQQVDAAWVAMREEARTVKTEASVKVVGPMLRGSWDLVSYN